MTTDLIKRLTEAGEGSRALNEELFDRLNGRKRAISTFEQYEPSERLPDYTGNLQDAVSAVPEGMEWQVSNRAPKPHAGRAYIHNREPIHSGLGGMTPNPEYRGYEVTAATPELALCIAILKALEAKDE